MFVCKCVLQRENNAPPTVFSKPKQIEPMHRSLSTASSYSHVSHLYRKMGRLATTVGFVSTKKYFVCLCGGRAGGGQYCYFILFFTSLFIIDRPLSYQLHSVGLSVSTFPSMYTSVELVVISDLVARTN